MAKTTIRTLSRAVVLGLALSAVGCGSNSSAAAPAQLFRDGQQLSLEDGSPQDFFGYSLALSGSTAVVGAPRRAGDAPEKGAAFVFVKDGDEWQMEATLTADDGAFGDHFGLSVAISGNTIVIGAPEHQVDGQPFEGAAYVFTREGTTWTQQGGALTANDGAAADSFGTSVATTETEGGAAVAIVGAPHHDVEYGDEGAAYAFARTGSTWTQQGGALIAANGRPGEVFGSAVAVSGLTALVGAPVHQVGAHPYQGGVYVFVSDGNQWTQQGPELVADDGGSFDQLSVCALSGDLALVGAPYHVIGNQPRGAAYLFSRHDETWRQDARLTPADGADGDEFGTAVALSNSGALISAAGRDSGSVYFFSPNAEQVWQEQSPRLTTPGSGGPNGVFGVALALSETNALIGNPYRAFDKSSAQGIVYTFVGTGLGE